jgi:type 1 glutamine amidotransferase
MLSRILFMVLIATVCCALAGEPNPVSTAWRPLFDGKTLEGWKVTDFGGHGEVAIETNAIRLDTGVALTGVQFTNPTPAMNYEIAVEAMKLDGGDFFCGLTFPVSGTHCTFIVGGWGGSVVGISSVDGMDASENPTTKFMRLEDKRWYKIRVRVSEERIECWIDDDRMIDQPIKGRKVSMRPGEIEKSEPFGIATYQTTALIRSVKIRSIHPESDKLILFIAGAKSHGPGEHEYEKGLRLLKNSLENSTNISGIATELVLNGWPEDESLLDRAATIVLYSDGSDHTEYAHPLLRGDHLKKIAAQMDRGAGLVSIHYTIFVPISRGGPEFLDWLGGYFDYQTGDGPNKWFSKIELRDYAVRPASSNHPVLNGVGPFNLKEEYYFNMKFQPNDARRTPILTFGTNNDPAQVVAWSVERKNGGRGFVYTGGHYHKNWEIEPVRRMLLNAVCWTARLPIPTNGVEAPLELVPVGK